VWRGCAILIEPVCLIKHLNLKIIKSNISSRYVGAEMECGSKVRFSVSRGSWLNSIWLKGEVSQKQLKAI